jgi:hypothetical protein
MHRAPNGTIRIELIKQVVKIVEVHQAIWVIHPVSRRGKMNKGTVWFYCLMFCHYPGGFAGDSERQDEEA